MNTKHHTPRARRCVEWICALSVLLGPWQPAAPAEVTAAQATYRFEIAGGPLDAVLAEFQRFAGVGVVPPPQATIQGLSSPGVSGILTADQALGALLTGTGLTFRLSTANTYALEVEGVTETVEVTAGMPYRAEATVTATRTLTPLRDVPQAVTIVPRAVIADLGMQGLADVVQYVPGVGMAQGEGNRDTPVLRGTSTTADMFVDGIRDDVQYFRDLYNVEYVEAVKGPNAMIFGRGGSGGIINRVTRQADWSTVRQITLQGSSDERRRATLDVGQQLSSAVAARLTTVYEDSGSYRDGVSVTRYGINPTLAFMLRDSTTVRVGYERFDDERIADRGIPSFGDRPVTTDAARFFGDPDNSPTTVTVNALTAGIDHRLGSGVLVRNRTRFADYDKFYQNIFPNSAANASGVVLLGAYNNATQRQNLFSQTDLNLTATTGRVKHLWLAGVELGRQETDNFRQTGYFTGLGPTVTSMPISVASPTVSVPVTFRQSATDADNHGVATVGALYVQDQVEFSRHVHAVAGIRYDRFNVDFRNNRTGVNISSTDNLVSPRAGLLYKPIEPVSFYASYSLAYIPRAGEQLSSLSLTNQALDPERFTNREVGVKWDVERELSVTAAVFQLNRTNVAVPDPVDPTRSLLVAGQRVKGVELGLAGQVTPRWSTMGAYAYQNGRITRTLSASAPEGAVLAHIPAHTFSLWNKYNVSAMWGAGVGIIHNADRFTSTANNVVLPSYTRVDGALFVTLTQQLRAQVNIENLFDRDYYAFAHNNNNITPGAPRAVRLSLTTDF